MQLVWEEIDAKLMQFQLETPERLCFEDLVADGKTVQGYRKRWTGFETAIT